MRIRTRTLIAAASLAACAAADAADVAAVASYGSEGGTTYYQVRCSDGALASLRTREAPPEICVRRTDAPEQCLRGSTVRAAAELACR